MIQIPLIHTDHFHDQDRYTCNVNGRSFLVLKSEDRYYIIENKCGHFGVPLTNARVERSSIQCLAHGAKFCLASGRVLNNAVESCVVLAVFEHVIIDNVIYICLHC